MSEQLSKIMVIGGSFLTELPEFKQRSSEPINTPFGNVPLSFGKMDGLEMIFLNRHGPGHILTPSEINYAANIFAAKLAGATTVVSICAAGSLQHEIVPGHIGLVNDYVDHTRGKRRDTFFGNGIVAHISPVPAYCPEAYRVTADIARKTLPAGTFHEGGIELVIEGTRFSTTAESFINQGHSYQYIGMTALPEAFLAMEAELCHVTLVVVTDFDAWKISHAVTVAEVERVFEENGGKVQELIRALVPALSALPRKCLCPTRLDNAIQTKVVTPETRILLAPIIGRLLPAL